MFNAAIVRIILTLLRETTDEYVREVGVVV